MNTMTTTRPRVTVENGWAVRSLDDGSQVRARLIHDPYHPEPERGAGMWNSGVSLVRERDGYGGAELDDHDGLRTVLGRIGHDGRYWWVTREGEDQERLFEPGMGIRDYWKRCEHEFKGGETEAQEFVARYLRAFWDVQHVSLRHHSGYSQSDWADIWVIVEGVEEGVSPDNLADATWFEWDAWAKGDVYIVESQTRTLTDAMCADPRDPDDGWGDREHVGGHYGDEGARAGLMYALGVGEADVPALWDVTKESY